MGVPEKAVYDILKSDNPQSEVFLIDESGEIMSCGDKALLNHPVGEVVEKDGIWDMKKGWFVDENTNQGKSIVTYTTLSKAGMYS